jgi:Na+-driven multidrug efflux pump
VLSVLLVLRSSLQGVGRKLVPISGSVVELALKIAAVAYFAPHFGYFGICICEPVIWIACAIIVVVDYTRFIKRSVSMKPVEKGSVAV